MRIRTKKRLLYSIGCVFLACAAGVVYWAWANPPELTLPDTGSFSRETGSDSTSKAGITMAEWKPLLAKRLQGPLVDPPPKTKEVTVQTKPAEKQIRLPWSNTAVENILFSPDAAVAVISMGGKKRTVTAGQVVDQVTVAEILKDEVIFEFKGKSFRVSLRNKGS